MEDKAMTKVKDLTPASKQVNVLVKVVSLSEEREITSKFGEARKLVEATVGDETGTVLLTLWNDQIGSVHKDETLLIDNGYVTLVRGHIRLNVGKYGTMAKSEQMIENVNTALDVSAVEYEREPRYRSGGYSGERRERSGGGDRQFELGTFSGNRSGGGGRGSGGRDRDRRGRGWRRDFARFDLFSSFHIRVNCWSLSSAIAATASTLDENAGQGRTGRLGSSRELEDGRREEPRAHKAFLPTSRERLAQ